MKHTGLAIGINGSMLDDQPSGVGVYSFNVINNLSALYAIDKLRKLTVFTPTTAFLHKDISIIKLSMLMQSSRHGKIAAFSRFCWNTFLYHFKARKFDLVISPTTHGSFLLKNQIITIHDLLSLRYNNISPHQRFYFKFLLPKLISRSKLIITVSETTKKDIIHFFNCPEEKVKVIHNGYDDTRYYLSTENENLIEQKYNVRKYLLAVGPTYPHKNFETLLNSYNALSTDTKQRYPLVIAGGKKKYIDHLEQLVRKQGLDPYVRFLGYVPIELMPALYREAFAMVFPSLYEGFGIPLLEAMACGCPVISSKTSSMPEVCGDAVEYFDPLDTKALTASIEKIITNESFRKELKEKGLVRSRKFSWKQTAQSLKTLIETHFQNTQS
ncbi:MAG: glycosyltransferase family 1 protein [Chitinophagaceae bacterium]